MKHSLLTPAFTVRLRQLGGAVAALALMAAFAPHAAWAQVPFDTFDDGDVSDVLVFSGSGGGIGVGITDGYDGTPDAALSVGMNPAEIGGFAGFVIPGGEGTTDVSGTSYLSFYVRPTTVQATNVPLTLEINLHEDTNGDGVYDGAVDDEYQALYRLEPGAGYSFVQIPLASFTDDNAVFPGADDGFDFSSLLEIVVAVGGVEGPELTFAMDDIIFLEAPAGLDGPVTEFDFFDDGDVSDVLVFSETGGGIGVGPIDDASGMPERAMNVGIDPSGTGGFAGFVIPGPAGTMDVSDAQYLTFQVRPTVQEANLPLTLEINLHEDTNGNGVYDGAVDDEYQALYRITGSSAFVDVYIPLASFTDDNAVFPGADDGFDFSNLLEVVFAIGGPTGPGFAISFDQFGFTSGLPVANEDGSVLPGVALSAAYPNPFTAQARFDLTLERAEAVRVEVLDVLGRRVRLLHDGPLAAGTPHTFEVEAVGLPAGLYLYRAVGETFAQTRRLTLVK